MNRKTNTLISLLLSLVLIFGTSGAAFAEDANSIDEDQTINYSTPYEDINDEGYTEQPAGSSDSDENQPPEEKNDQDETSESDGTQTSDENLASVENFTPENDLPLQEKAEADDEELIALLSAINDLTEEVDASAGFDGYIVKVKEDEVTEEMIEAAPSELIADSIFVVESPEEVLDFAEPEEIEYIEPNYRISSFSFPETDPPNDQDYSEKQWNLQSGYGIHAQGMWSKGLSGAGSRVAVIDSGVNGTHQDWNPGTVLDGYSFVSSQNPSASNPNIKAGTNSDDVGHGTVVASIIAASTNNGKNIAGIAYESKIVPMKVLYNSGGGATGNVSDVIKALNVVYALNSDSDPANDISVVNMSIGTDGKNTDFQTAINKIVAQGTVVVAAAGNGWPNGASNPNYTTILYPAGYDNVIGVAATNKAGSKAYYSQHNTTVDIAAPGGIATELNGGIVGLYYDNTYSSTTPGQGTSFAAPHVAAMAAVAKGHNKLLSPAQIQSLILSTASDPSTDLGNTEYYGAGIANATAFANVIKESYSKTVVTTTVAANERTVALNAENVGLFGPATQVRFAVWGEAGGQNDLYWYNGTKGSGDIWNTTVDISRHKEPGKYNAHAYATINGQSVLVGHKTFNITANKATGLTYSKVSPGIWQVTLSGVSAVSGVSKVELATWSDHNGQDDLAWPAMTQTSPSTYTVTIRASDHKFDGGLYNTHAYVTSNNGIRSVVRAGTFQMDLPSITMNIAVAANERTVAVSAENVGLFGPATQVRFAVWGEAGGQNDLYWYNGTKGSGDIWNTTVDISRHKEPGKYQVHVYATINGQSVLVGHKTFNITANSATILTSTREADGAYTLSLSNINARSGVERVELAVWSTTNGQDDLTWYEAPVAANGFFDTSLIFHNHNNETGEYNIHAYVTSGNGVRNVVKTHIFNVNAAPLQKSVSVSADEIFVQLTIKYPGFNIGRIESMQVAVWSEINGQDDLCWYTGTRNGDTWSISLNPSRHRSTGKFYVHPYVTTSESPSKIISEGVMEFNITKVFYEPLKGVDVSYWQGNNINWTAVRNSGVQFAILRAGYTSFGGSYFEEDSTFIRNYHEAKSKGILVGAYIYMYSRNEAEQRKALESFNARMKAYGVTFDLPVYLDVEDSKYYLPSTNALGGYNYRTDMMRAGLNQLKGYGYKPGFYSYLNWAQTQFNTQQLINEGYSFWLARYYANNAELDPYTLSWNNGFPDIWQYRSTGSVPGISGNVDMNYLYPDKISW